MFKSREYIIFRPMFFTWWTCFSLIFGFFFSSSLQLPFALADEAADTLRAQLHLQSAARQARLTRARTTVNAWVNNPRSREAQDEALDGIAALGENGAFAQGGEFEFLYALMDGSIARTEEAFYSRRNILVQQASDALIGIWLRGSKFRFYERLRLKLETFKNDGAVADEALNNFLFLAILTFDFDAPAKDPLRLLLVHFLSQDNFLLHQQQIFLWARRMSLLNQGNSNAEDLSFQDVGNLLKARIEIDDGIRTWLPLEPIDATLVSLLGDGIANGGNSILYRIEYHNILSGKFDASSALTRSLVYEAMERFIEIPLAGVFTADLIAELQKIDEDSHPLHAEESPWLRARRHGILESLKRMRPNFFANFEQELEGLFAKPFKEFLARFPENIFDKKIWRRKPTLVERASRGRVLARIRDVLDVTLDVHNPDVLMKCFSFYERLGLNYPFSFSPLFGAQWQKFREHITTMSKDSPLARAILKRSSIFEGILRGLRCEVSLGLRAGSVANSDIAAAPAND